MMGFVIAHIQWPFYDTWSYDSGLKWLNICIASKTLMLMRNDRTKDHYPISLILLTHTVPDLPISQHSPQHSPLDQSLPVTSSVPSFTSSHHSFYTVALKTTSTLRNGLWWSLISRTPIQPYLQGPSRDFIWAAAFRRVKGVGVCMKHFAGARRLVRKHVSTSLETRSEQGIWTNSFLKVKKSWPSPDTEARNAKDVSS